MFNDAYKFPVLSSQQQIYVMVLFESPLQMFYNIGLTQDIFNMTMTYLNHSETDIVVPYGTFITSKGNRASGLSNRGMVFKKLERLYVLCQSVYSVQYMSLYLPDECGFG